MAVGPTLAPRFAVTLTGDGMVSIRGLEARCLWYPADSIDGRTVSGHVIYMPRALLNEAETELRMLSGTEIMVKRSAPDITHLLSAPFNLGNYATVPEMLDAMVSVVWPLLAKSKKGSLPERPHELRRDAIVHSQRGVLTLLEDWLSRGDLHILLPITIANFEHLFTDATEVLREASPLNIRKRNPRLCFVLLTSETLDDRLRTSPWLREASQLIALPPHLSQMKEVAIFISSLGQFNSIDVEASRKEHLCDDLQSVAYQVCGGWPDLCHRFIGVIGDLRSISALEERLQKLQELLHQTPLHTEAARHLIKLALGDGPEPAELAHGELAELCRPRPFRWEDHGSDYLAGKLSWNRSLAVPRSQLIEAVLRAIYAAPSSHGDKLPAHRLRWLHLSDLQFRGLHFEEAHEALLLSVQDLKRSGRHIDLIFITGDIAWSGRADQYETAERFLLHLCDSAGVSPSAVHMVPGNHDVERAMPQGLTLRRTLDRYHSANRLDSVEEYFGSGEEPPHLSRLETFRKFYDRFYSSRPTPSRASRKASARQATSDPEIVFVGDLSVGILPLNSAWFSYDEHDSGKLFVGAPLVRAGVEKIRSATVRIALLHHRLTELSEHEQSRVTSYLSKDCHFVLHGCLRGNALNPISPLSPASLALATGTTSVGTPDSLPRGSALFVEVHLTESKDRAIVHPYPLKYEKSGPDRWTLDTLVYPYYHPTYLQHVDISLIPKGR